MNHFLNKVSAILFISFFVSLAFVSSAFAETTLIGPTTTVDADGTSTTSYTKITKNKDGSATIEEHTLIQSEDGNYVELKDEISHYDENGSLVSYYYFHTWQWRLRVHEDGSEDWRVRSVTETYSRDTNKFERISS